MDSDKSISSQEHTDKQTSLSRRLTAVCLAAEELALLLMDMCAVTEAEGGEQQTQEILQQPLRMTLCDVGCDHALVPISLLKRGVFDRAIGLDVNVRPLERARDNLGEYGIGKDALSLRLSNGLQALQPGEAQIVVIAGMGGLLVKEILECSDLRALGIKALVLSPHTKQAELRSYLRSKGYDICAEKEICDDGKYYPIISVLVNVQSTSYWPHSLEQIRQASGCTQEEALRLGDAFGPLLLRDRDEVLHEYLLKREKEVRRIRHQIAQNGSDHADMEQRLTFLATALRLWEKDNRS